MIPFRKFFLSGLFALLFFATFSLAALPVPPNLVTLTPLAGNPGYNYGDFQVDIANNYPQATDATVEISRTLLLDESSRVIWSANTVPLGTTFYDEDTDMTDSYALEPGTYWYTARITDLYNGATHLTVDLTNNYDALYPTYPFSVFVPNLFTMSHSGYGVFSGSILNYAYASSVDFKVTRAPVGGGASVDICTFNSKSPGSSFGCTDSGFASLPAGDYTYKVIPTDVLDLGGSSYDSSWLTGYFSLTITRSVVPNFVTIERTDADTFEVTTGFQGADSAHIIVTRQLVGENPVVVCDEIKSTGTSFDCVDLDFDTLVPGTYRYSARVTQLYIGGAPLSVNLGDNSDSVIVLVSQAAATSQLPDMHPLFAVVAFIAVLFVLRK